MVFIGFKVDVGFIFDYNFVVVDVEEGVVIDDFVGVVVVGIFINC